MISDEEQIEKEALEDKVIERLLNYSQVKGHEFTNGSQRVEAREIIKLVKDHLKKVRT